MELSEMCIRDSSEFSIRLLNDGSFLDVYAMPKDNTPFDMRDIIKKRNSKKD